MKIITIASLKGGVGKTALSILLSNETVAKKKNVTTIDLDSQASLTDFYLRELDPTEIFNSNIFHYLSDQKPIQRLTREIEKNHNIIPAALNLSRIGAFVSGDPSIIKEHSEAIRDLAQDYIFIDCPPSPSYEFRVGVASSDLVLVPVSLDRWSIQGLSLLMEETKKLKDSGFFRGEIAIVPSLVTEKEGDSIREKINLKGIKILKNSFLKKSKIRSSLNTGAKIKDGSEEQTIIRAILKEIL